MNRDAILTVPNLLTASRLLLAPVVVWRLGVGDVAGAFWLFALAALTDLFDGALARLLDQKTVLGAWLDPIADKAMLLSCLAMLAWLGLLPVYLAVLVALRDAVVLGGAAACRCLTGGLRVAPTWLGKVATCVEFFVVALALAEPALALGLGTWLQPLTHLAAALALLSGGHYVWRGARSMGSFRS